ncbi:hypothetical protein [uncultured Friedmanniella sp.]|uniref:hypothetical protein n=1 Tax=uncultured Friedmanniella sp. TaxID=335381 RepID=UPI0035CC4CE4
MPDLLRRSGPKLAVGGLVVLNVVLIGALALRAPEPVTSAVPAAGPTISDTPRATSSPSPSGSPTRSASPSAPPSTSASPSPSASPKPSASSSASADPPTDSSPQPGSGRPRVLAASSGRIAWRAEPSRCGSSATVEVTTDGGRHWTARDPGIGSVVRLKTYGDDAVFAIGADSRCRPTYAWTTGPREPWQHDRSLVRDIWFRRPGALDTVHAPSGKQSRPCGGDLVSLAGLGTYQAAVLCGDGRIRTDDVGRSWRTVATRTGALSLNADDLGFVAAVVRPGCSGTVIARFDQAGTGLGRSAGRCRKASASSGSTAVAIRDGATWLWAADRVHHY